MKCNESRQSVLRWWYCAVMVVSGLVLTGCTPATSLLPPSNLHADERIDTAVQTEGSSRKAMLTELFDAAYIDQEIYQRHDTIFVRWPVGLEISSDMLIRIQSPTGRIYLEKHFLATASAEANLGKAYLLPEGEYDIVLMPPLGEYYEGGVRVQRKLAIQAHPDEWLHASR